MEIRTKTRVTDIAQRVARQAEVVMGGAHSSKKESTLVSQGAGMAAPHWQAQRWSTPNEVDRRHRSRRR
ncbi:jg11286 [Pararge aegeria aegeria]|uniref:Jg11286 protein n=1 Tax=Pararge aegeria aegeria TaxID=348720 RepID=A0A8S4QZ48_9NEOP|nr:jg11286 [Pararge aegeria aegeria]